MTRVNELFNGVVMQVRDYREHDQLIKFLTDKQGPAMFLVRQVIFCRLLMANMLAGCLRTA